METVTTKMEEYLDYTISKYAGGYLGVRFDEKFNQDRKLWGSTIGKLIELIKKMEEQNGKQS